VTPNVPAELTVKLFPEPTVTPVRYFVSVPGVSLAEIEILFAVATSPVGTYPAVETLALIDKLETEPLPVAVTEIPLVSVVLQVTLVYDKLAEAVIEPLTLDTDS